MDYKKNKVLPWATLAATVLFSVLYVFLIVGMSIDMDITLLRISALTALVLSILVIVLALVTARVNRIYDPMTERVEALNCRYTGFVVILAVLPIIFEVLLYAFIPDFENFAENDPARASFLVTVVTIYLTGFPFLLLTLRKVPVMKIEKRRMGFSFFILCLAVTAGLCLAGVIIGLPIEMLLTEPFKSADSSDQINHIAEIMQNSSFIDRVIVVGVLAPVFEELIFRKLLVSRTIRYGETFSILLSGFMFGLFHGNFQQFFFASFVGMLFAFVFIRTGRVIYTILMHMTVNLTTSVVTTTLYIKLLPYIDDADNLTEMPYDIQLLFLTLTFWMLLLGMIAVTGFILLIVFRKRFKPYKSPDEPSLGKIIGNSLSSPLFWCFIVIQMGQFASSYLPDIVDYLL